MYIILIEGHNVSVILTLLAETMHNIYKVRGSNPATRKKNIMGTIEKKKLLMGTIEKKKFLLH